MATQATDTSSSEEEIDYTYHFFQQSESDFEYEGKAGYTCEPDYFKEELRNSTEMLCTKYLFLRVRSQIWKKIFQTLVLL